MLWDNFKLEVRDKTIDHCKKLANSKKNEIKKLKNELKYLEEPSNTSTYKEGGKYGNIFFSEAIALIEPKLCINHWKVLYKLCVFYVDCNSKMTTTAGHSFYIGPIGFFYNQVNLLKEEEEKPYISVSINPENIRFFLFTNGGHTRKSIMAAIMFLRIKRSILLSN
jgi:hypothetical protein